MRFFVKAKMPDGRSVVLDPVEINVPKEAADIMIFYDEKPVSVTAKIEPEPTYDKIWNEQSIDDEELNEIVNHPKHYNNNESGVECIDVVEWMTFNQGNAVKYLWRMFDKGDVIENLDKAIWYCQREKERLRKEKEEHYELFKS